MQVGAGVMYEAAEEILSELGLQVADEVHLDQIFVDQEGASAEIDGDHGEGLVHRHDEVAGAVDAFAIAEGFGEQLAEHDADVFHGVVLVDVEIAFGLQGEVEAAVLGEQLQHMVEEANAGGDVIASAAFDFQGAADACLFGIALDGGGSHAANTSGRTLMSSMMAQAPSCWKRKTRSMRSEEHTS